MLALFERRSKAQKEAAKLSNIALGHMVSEYTKLQMGRTIFMEQDPDWKLIRLNALVTQPIVQALDANWLEPVQKHYVWCCDAVSEMGWKDAQL